jgi:DNA-binding NtrC family response regulator
MLLETYDARCSLRELFSDGSAVTSAAHALVVEDDPGQLDLIAATMREAQVEPLRAISPDGALEWLKGCQPVLAVVDLDMSMAPDSKATIEDLLAFLAAEHGSCFVIVHSVRSDQILERKRIEAIHPFAMFVSKQDGARALVDRIQRIMGVHFGDLLVRRGLTTHEPTGERFLHPIGMSLVMAAAAGHEVTLSKGDAKAARRMRDWLEHVGSRVEFIDLGHRCFVLLDRKP